MVISLKNFQKTPKIVNFQNSNHLNENWGEENQMQWKFLERNFLKFGYSSFLETPEYAVPFATGNVWKLKLACLVKWKVPNNNWSGT